MPAGGEVGLVHAVLDRLPNRYGEALEWKYVDGRSVEEIGPLDALRIGAFQMLALVPGTSRSAATILGGLLTGLDRRTAAEFSFFVAIPVMLAATGYKLLDAREPFAPGEVQSLVVSSVAAFFAALLAIRFLLRFVSKHSFAGFAYYRIVIGGAALVWLMMR